MVIWVFHTSFLLSHLEASFPCISFCGYQNDINDCDKLDRDNCRLCTRDFCNTWIERMNTTLPFRNVTWIKDFVSTTESAHPQAPNVIKVALLQYTGQLFVCLCQCLFFLLILSQQFSYRVYQASICKFNRSDGVVTRRLDECAVGALREKLLVNRPHQQCQTVFVGDE